jgi:serine/threonine protein kinase
VKWLALESFTSGTYSSYSDVWAFGVVLWELFTLGQVPYAGLRADSELFNKIKDGYRLEKPEYCTEKLYDLMLSCWFVVQNLRPSFERLANVLGDMLPLDVKLVN